MTSPVRNQLAAAGETAVVRQVSGQLFDAVAPHVYNLFVSWSLRFARQARRGIGGPVNDYVLDQLREEVADE